MTAAARGRRCDEVDDGVDEEGEGEEEAEAEAEEAAAAAAAAAAVTAAASKTTTPVLSFCTAALLGRLDDCLAILTRVGRRLDAAAEQCAAAVGGKDDIQLY